MDDGVLGMMIYGLANERQCYQLIDARFGVDVAGQMLKYRSIFEFGPKIEF